MQAAAWTRSRNIVQALLDYGCSPNEVSSSISGTPIQIAVREGDPEIVQILLRHKGDLNIAHGLVPQAALQMAFRDVQQEMVEVPITYRADVNSRPAKQNGATGLQFAAARGHPGIAHLLMQYEADVNALPAEIDGRTLGSSR
jgi:ankyrin repeat protein